MRVLWVNEYGSFIGGCEHYIYNTANLLRQHGVRSTLLYHPKHPVDPQFLESFEEAYPICNLTQQLEEIPHDVIYLHQVHSNDNVESFLDSPSPVIRFFHDYELFCLRKSKIRPFTNKPCDCVAGCHCYPLGCSLRPSDNLIGMRLRTMEEMKCSQKLNQQLDGYIVASEYVANQVLGNGFDAEKLRTIPLYALDYPFNPIERDQNTMFFVGQLIRGKGLDIALRAVAEIGLPYHLVIAGEGKQEKKYRSLARSLKIEDQVSFLGKISQDELKKWYQKASCVVFPTRYPELFGLVGVEAMSFGTPVIASHVGAVPEWLEDGKTGFTVPPNDPKALASKVRTICTDATLANNLGMEARRSYEEKFLPEKHLKQLLQFFEDSIETKRKKTTMGKLTVYGSELLENKIQSLLKEVVSTIKKQISKEKYRAILLIGGYGKGEGGRIVSGGEENPHNNLDFFIITRGHVKNLCERIRELIAPISEKYQIGFDISAISDLKLRLSPTHLVWYEMVHGHRFLLGDRNFVQTLPFQDVKTVLPRDFLELMVNRGTLLIINAFLLDFSPELSLLHRRVFIKHMMKATIGFGDAYLFFHGHYHWSYKERLNRISIHPDIPEKLKKSYCEAAEFRFNPNYEDYLEKDFRKWLEELVQLFSDIFLECEQLRLQDWDVNNTTYFDKVLLMSITEKLFTWPGMMRKVKGLIHKPQYFVGTTLAAKAGFWLLTPAERLSVAFPIVAFGIGESEIKRQVAHYLNVENTSATELRRSYLKEWSRDGDINFSHSIKEWGISVE